MAPSKNLGQYSDIKTIFDVVVSRGPVTKRFPTKSAAIRFRQRGYYFRTLLHNKQREALGLEIAETSTPYDSIKMTIPVDDVCLVRVEEIRYTGGFVFDDGSPVEVANPITVFDQSRPSDPLLASAEQLAKDLGL